MMATSTVIPAILVIITTVKLGSLAYYNLLTPEEVEYENLIITSLLSMLLVLLIQVIFVFALTVNIYFFSEKIFHLVSYKRILTVLKYSYFYLPAFLITNICFVVSEREASGATVAFAFFNLISAVVMVYIIISSEESQWFELCKKKRSKDEMLEDYEMKIKGDS